MMRTPKRHNRNRSRSIEDLASLVPDHLRTFENYLEVKDGVMTGRLRYVRELDDWLRTEVGLPPVDLSLGEVSGETPVYGVMNEIGVGVAEWYEAVLTRGWDAIR